MVSRVFAEGRKGFEGEAITRKYEAISKCPSRKVARDLSGLVIRDMIVPQPVMTEQLVMSWLLLVQPNLI